MTGGGVCPRRKNRGRGGGFRSTACPFTLRLVTCIPSVRFGSASARGTSGAKRFWSSRSTITRIALSLGFWTTTCSCPVTAPLAVSSRAAIV
ncbi:MAG: hypothetical protein B7Z72_14910 [Gemmatimonadetes bacterium 21-71-4]|nr:MAG: hypothetical protein B7Z72_14910 [Gemmatimonadetes bacterium 21-71-4]